MLRPTMTMQFRPERIREIRTALGLSRAELATKIGVTRQLVWAWEAGKHVPGTEVLLRLANLTGAKMESFFGLEPYRHSGTRKATA